MNRNNIHYQITDFRTEEMKKKEKLFYQTISKMYKSAYHQLKALLYNLFEQYADHENKLHQKDLFQYGRDQKLKKEIATVISDLSKEELKLLTNEIHSVIEEESTYALFILAMLGIPNRKPLTDKQKKEILDNRWVAETYIETHKKNKSLLADGIYSSVVAGTLGGITLNQLVKQTKTRLESGVKKEMMLYQTEGHRKKNEAYSMVFNKQGDFEKVIYLCSLDERTCPTCSQYDGKKFDVNNAPNVPQHPRCRCILLPDLSALGHSESPVRSARDTRTGQSYLTDKKTYSKWKNEVNPNGE